MYINGIAGYLSRFEGTEVDAAVARTQTLDAELALKVDKSTEVNGHALESDINISATDVGALPDTTQYGASISWNNGILSLLDASGVPISSQYVTSEAQWGHITGLLSDQEDLQEVLDGKYDSSNPAGYITGITSSDVTTALGYTPYNSTNPDGYISEVTSSDVTSALGYTPYNSANPDGYITGITSSDVTTALGYTPYNSTNPAGYITGISSSDVTTALGFIPYSSANPNGYISGITGSDVTTALGYTPYNATNPNGYISSASLSGLTDTSLSSVTGGQLLTYNSTSSKWENKSLTSSNITTALGYTPYNSTNPNGYISGISSSDVVNALGYTPYDNSNPSGYVTADDIPVVDQVYDGTSENAQSGTAVAGAISTKQNTITAQNMLSSDLVDDTNKVHKFATAAQLSQIATNTGDISSINSKIPSVASSSNQLADKEFVNSSIASNTANFIGTFNSLAELEAYSGPLTNNDYAFVTNVDGEGNTSYDRYKYTTATTPPSWVFEYELNNSSFTTAQWDAINSGIDAILTAQISTNATDIININSTLENYGDIVTHDVSEFATSAQGALADTALQPNDNISELTNNVGYITGISSSDVTTALGYTPYNSTNPNGYISSASLEGLTDTNLSSVTEGQFLEYSSTTSKWVNRSLASSDVTTALGYTPYNSSNPDGYISGISSSDVTTALGYTPYNSTNPNGYITGISSSDVTTALGYTPYNSANPNGYISGITSSDVVNALGYTPYSSSNPSGYISSASLNGLTDTSLSTLTNGQFLEYNSSTAKWENKSLTSSNVTTALGYTPYNSTNPAGYITGITDSDVVTALGYTPYDSNNPDGYISSASLSGLTDTSLSNLVNKQFLEYNSSTSKWENKSLSNSDIVTALGYTPYSNSNPSGYISGITSSDVTTALGYTPYNSTNPDGYISGITSSDVTTALGYTPYNSTNPDGFISSASLSGLTDTSISSPAGGQIIIYNSTSGKWENANAPVAAVWGNITGTLSNQTDLQNALNAKQSTITGAASTVVSNNLTESRVVVSSSSGKISASSISTTKLGYLTDVTSNIQAQLNGKQATISNLSSIESGAAAGATAVQPGDNISRLENNVGYITGISSSDVTTALGYTPYSSANPDGYITGITSSDVTTALGYTPYNSTNPSGYISSAALSTLTDVSLSNVTNGQHLVYNSTSGKWENETSTQVTAWGDITGTLSSQTDLQNALNAKQNTINGAASTIASDNLTVSRVLVSNDSGKVAASSISTTKLGYLTDVTSNIQVQLNGKQPTLVSGTNIKTINSESLLGDGDIVIDSGASIDDTTPSTETVYSSQKVQTELNSKISYAMVIVDYTAS